MGKEYKLVGGNGTTIEELEVTEDGTYKAGESRAFNPVIVKTGGGGGGSGGSVLLLHVDGQTLALDKTAKEILDAVDAGKSIVLDGVASGGEMHTYNLFIGYYASVNEGYWFYFIHFDDHGGEVVVQKFEFGTDTENGYPVFTPPAP